MAIEEIRRYQLTVESLIPRRPFMQLAKEVMQDLCVDFRMTSTALMALQEASEAYLVRILEESQLCAIHDNRVTVMPRDMQLVHRIHEDK